MEQGRMYSNMGTAGMLGLEMPLHSRHPPKTAGATNAAQMVDFSDNPPQIQLSMRQSFPYAPPPNKQPRPHPSSATSDDDEPGGSANDDGGSYGKRKVSPWHRMKWTDTMVKLLIMAVYYIGDDAGTTSSDGPDTNKKPKLSASSAGGLLQKKGKWKSVSRAMMEKGYCVSPQQCEDKFNDLNKRYKRVNDILGRGTACRVVENQNLMESMDLSPKLKEEVRKLLNSKHLFFREMCAYHNSCGHGSAVVAPHHSPESATEKHNSHTNNIQNDELEEEDEDEEDYEEEEENRGDVRQGNEEGGSMICAQLKGEIMSVIGDGSKSVSEKQQWVGMRALQLEEAGLKYQLEAFEIEKQRLKWAIYSSKKEREIERMKIDNERRRLENQRMLLLLRQKELEMSHN